MAETKGDGPTLRYGKDGAIAWITADNPSRMNACIPRSTDGGL